MVARRSSGRAKVRYWMLGGALALAACGSSTHGGPDPDDGLQDIDPTRFDPDAGWDACGGRIECRQISGKT